MNEGANPLVTDIDGKTKYTAQKDPTLAAYIAQVDGQPYYSGMPVVLPYGNSKEPKYLTLYIDTGATVNSVSYEITGDEVPGGDQRQTGTVKLGKPEEQRS